MLLEPKVFILTHSIQFFQCFACNIIFEEEKMLDKFDKKRVCLMAWNISTSMFHFGYFLLYITQIPISTIKQIYNIPLGDAVSLGILNGCIPIGGLLGSLGSSFFVSRFSRRENMLICNALLFAVGWLIFIKNFPMLIICRLFQGICVGFFTSMVPLIINEISPLELSGAVGTYTQLNILLGVFIGCIYPYALLKITGDSSGWAYWYLVFGLPQVVIVIQALVLIFIYPYETPKYHLTRGEEEEAKKIIAVLYKPEFLDEILKEKKENIQASETKETVSILQSGQIGNLEAQKEETAAVKTIQTPKIAALVSVYLSGLLQMSGINVVAVYSVSISTSVTRGELSLLMPAIINLTAVLATVGSYFLAKSFGRRPILLYGTVAEGVANILMMIGYFFKGSNGSGEPIIMVGIFLFMISFGLSVGPIVWLYIPEIVQPQMMPFSVSVSWLTASLVVILFPILTKDYLNNNPAILFVFSALVCVAGSIANYFFVIETKGKGEKQIREQFAALEVCKQRLVE